MKEIIQLNKDFLDSMHDQHIYSVELNNKHLIFYYKDLHFYNDVGNKDNDSYYNKHKKFKSCIITFENSEDSYVEIRDEKNLTIKSQIYFINEFINYIRDNSYIIETISFFCSYEKILIEGTLIDKKGNYLNDCIIIIPATTVIYEWK